MIEPGVGRDTDAILLQKYMMHLPYYDQDMEKAMSDSRISIWKYVTLVSWPAAADAQIRPLFKKELISTFAFLS